MMKVQCKECEEMGHFARDCPNKKCRNCEKPGHGSRDCPVLLLSYLFENGTYLTG